MRLLFGATIAFSIPFHLFPDGRVVAHGAQLCLALLGKVVIGPLLTPVLTDVVVDESTPGSPSLGSDFNNDVDNQHVDIGRTEPWDMGSESPAACSSC
jgi:hypothetical protein